MNFFGLDAVRIVLVEPAGARNLGSVARVMKNFGFSQLVLVKPECDWRSDEARHMAVHAMDILEGAIVVQDLPSALEDCHRVAATVGRDGAEAESLRSVAGWLVDPPSPLSKGGPEGSLKSAIVFGREDHGLSNLELKYAQRCITIPSSPDYASLNLAQAVGICCYELSQQVLLGESAQEPLTSDAAPFQMTHAFYTGLEELLLSIGYLHDHTAESRMNKFRSLLDRAEPTHHEVTMLLGILRQAKWAIEHSNPAQNLLDQG